MKKICRYLFVFILSLALTMNSFAVTGFAEGDDIAAELTEPASGGDAIKEESSDSDLTHSDEEKEDSAEGSSAKSDTTEEQGSDGDSASGEIPAAGEEEPAPDGGSEGEDESAPVEEPKTDMSRENDEGSESGEDLEAEEKALSDAIKETDPEADPKDDSSADPEADPEADSKATTKNEGNDETEKDFPAFCESTSVGGITITVEAQEGVFPEGARLFAESIPSSETSGAISEKRSGDQNVARTYSFDIKVLDEDGNELQPEDGKSVKVSFSMTEVADPNLNVSIYHVSDEDHDAKELSVEVSGETAAAESDGFSYYTVEFTYGSLSYTLDGGERTSLSEILSAVGLVGSVTDVYVSNSELFSASKEDDEWVIYSHQAFSSDEWLKVTIEDITYEIAVTVDAEYSGTCGNGLTWTLSGNTLTISKTGDGDGAMDRWNNKTSVPWYNQRSDIEIVSIESGVATIGNCAFAGCSGLTSITLPDSLTYIGYSAFSGCSGLTSITLPDSLTTIGEYAFSGCRGLKSITLPDALTSIANYTFTNCSGLTSITLPDSLSTIGDDAFEYCSGLTSIILPDSFTTIGEYAFRGCSGLTSITFPDSLTYIGNDAFFECSSLTSITLPDCYTSIGFGAFCGCTGLTSITFPDSLTSIEEAAFAYCISLKSIILPDSLISIRDSAFYGCRGLTSITLPDSLTTIGEVVFSGCNNLTTVYYNGSDWGTFSDRFPSNVTLAGFVTVTADVNPTNGGTISGSGDGFIGQIGADQFRFEPGKNVCLTAIPATNYHFVKWTDANGTLLSNSASYSFPAAETTLKANFANISIDGNISSHTYDGKIYYPTLTVIDTATGIGLTVNIDYTISYQKYDGTDWSDISLQNVKDAGEYRVVATGISGSAYEGENATKDFTINPKAVTVTVQDKQFTYDGTPHSHSGYDISGLVGSDAIDATVTGSITFPSEGSVTNAVTAYRFTTGSAENYSVTTKNGQLTMAKASNPITITAASASKTYDGSALTDSTVTLTKGALFTGDSLIASADGSATNVSDTKVGNNPVAAGYKIMHGTVDVTDNYVVTTVAGTLTINSKTVTITDTDNKSSDNRYPNNIVSEDESCDPPANNIVYDVLKETAPMLSPLVAESTDAAVLGEVRKTSKKATDVETTESDNADENGAEVANEKNEETKAPEKTSETPQTETKIEETETAKAASPVDEEKPFAWGWLIFGFAAAIAGVSVEEYVRRHKNKA